MAVLVWWVLPTATTILGICWAAWVRRAPRAPSDTATVDGYARFRAALAAPAPRRAVGAVPVRSDAVREGTDAPSVAPPVDLVRPATSR